MAGNRRRLALVIALNLLLFGAWLSAQLETQRITVVATPQEVQAYVDGELVVAGRPPVHSGSVAVYLGESSYARDDASLARPIRALLGLVRESAWGSITVRSLVDGQVLLQTNLASGLAALLPGAPGVGQPLATGDWTEYVVDATLLRPRQPAGLIVYTDGLEGVLFQFRPEDRDAALWLSGPDGPISVIANGPYRVYHKTIPSAIQDVLRLLLHAYPLALGAALVAAALRRSFGRDWKRRSQSDLVALGASRAESERVAVLERPRPEREADGPASPIRIMLRGEGELGPAWESDVTTGATRQSRRLDPYLLAAAGLSLAVLAITGYVAYFVLQHMPHVQDSVAYLFQAKVFASGHLWAPVPDMLQFFEHEFVVAQDGKWFAKYPPGHPLLLAIGVLAGAPWLVNPVAAALSVLLLFLIGRRLYGAPTGLVAAALAVTSPFLIFLSGSFMSHPTGLLFVLLFTWLFLRRENWPSAFLAGVALGVGVLIRPWSAGVIAVPFAVVALADFARRPRATLPTYLLMAAGALPFVGAYLGYNAALTGDPFKNTMELWWAFDKVGFGADHGPFGHWPVDGFSNTSRNLSLLLVHLYGWPPFLTLFFVTLPFVLGRARRTDVLFLGGFLALVAGYFAWWADGVMYGPRFLYEGVGFLFLLSARGVVELAVLVQRTALALGASRRWLGAAASGLLVAVLIACNALFYFPGQWQLYHGYNYVNRDSLDAVEAAGIHDAIVFADVGGQYEWWWYGMVFSANSPFLDSDVVYARDLGPAEDAKLLARYPGRAGYRLAGTVITPLGN